MDNMAMNDNGVVGELRAIDGEKRKKYVSIDKEKGMKRT
jgi:hypothetical protein